MVPATCRHNQAALEVTSDAVVQTAFKAQRTSNQAARTHSQREQHTLGDADNTQSQTHSHTHQHPSSDKQSHSSWDTDDQEHSHHPGLEAVTVVEHSSNHADSHVVGHDNCCKHGDSCCTVAVMLPTVLDVLSPLLAQSKMVWDAPMLLAVTPHTFDRPPKPLTV